MDTATTTPAGFIKVINRSGGVHLQEEFLRGTVSAACGTRSNRYTPAGKTAVINCEKCQAI